MLGMNYELQKLEEEGKPIMASIVGAGQMGRGMTSQMCRMKGIKPAIVADICLDNVVKSFENSGLTKDDYIITNKLSEANAALEKGKYIATENSELASKADLIDAAVDATGVTEVGANIAVDCIKNHKHIVMLNVEADVVVGPILKAMADKEGVVYSGSDGDEPGAVKGLYDFAVALGFDVKAFGKGKNNAVDHDANPDSVREKAISRGVSPKMQCSFTDGTKTMVELTCMSNATGYVADVRGGHGPVATIKEVPKVLSLKEEGGILNSYGTVEWVNGIAPGVFVVFSSDLPFVNHELNYLSMGDGPNYVLYRPYHLCSLETPLTVARAVLNHKSTIVPMGGPVSETITVAKKDLKAGQTIDGIGGFCNYGTIESHKKAKELNALPLGLVTKNTKIITDVKKGDIITYDMVELQKETLIYKLRAEQDKMFD